MSTIAGTDVIPVSAAPPIAAVRLDKTWLVGPWFDAVFFANLFWPLVVLVSLQGSTILTEPLSAMQMYFLSTPHRWITLVLVFFDRDRFWKDPVRFGGVGAGLISAGLLLWWAGSAWHHATNSLILLMMLDYAWNAWHFAAQHAGITRIYGRMVKSDQDEKSIEFEKMAIRLLVLWCFVRLAVHVGSAGPFGDNLVPIQPFLPWLDPFAVAPAVMLLLREIRAFTPQAKGKLLYSASVIVLYASQLLAIRLGSDGWMKGLFLAGAVFHAVEYLAVCNWSVQRKSTGLWRFQLARTGLAVVFFMAVLGVTNLLVETRSAYTWAVVTLLVSLLHYAYDGMIWRAPRPAVKPA